MDQIAPITPAPSTAANDAAMAMLRAAGGFPPVNSQTGMVMPPSVPLSKIPDAPNPRQTKTDKPAMPTGSETMKYVTPPVPTYAPAGWANIGALMIPQRANLQRRGK